MYYDDWDPYVPVAARRLQAARELAALRKKGHQASPVIVEGRAIARTFWGKAWCDNLESYSDYANRMPRGRSYLRNGSVLDLQIQPGKVRAQVAGSSLYRIEVTIRPLPAPRWRAITSACSGQVDSLVDLLRGELSDAVLAILIDPARELFPAPGEISLSCSCPDWADMCRLTVCTFVHTLWPVDFEWDPKKAESTEVSMVWTSPKPSRLLRRSGADDLRRRI